MKHTVDKSILHAPCTAHLLDGRLVRGEVFARDPSCRVIGPSVTRLIGWIKLSARLGGFGAKFRTRRNRLLH